MFFHVNKDFLGSFKLESLHFWKIKLSAACVLKQYPWYNDIETACFKSVL